MIQSYSASLNSLGNPRIYGSNTRSTGVNVTVVDYLYNRFILEEGTTNVEIYITPVSSTVIDKYNTLATNQTVIDDLLAIGFTLTFEDAEQRFKLVGQSSASSTYSDISNLGNIIAFLSFKDGSDNLIEDQTLSIAFNKSVFLVEQKACSNCIDFTYQDGNYDFQNPLDNYGIGNRGQVEYFYQSDSGWISVGTSKLEEGVLGQSWNPSADVRQLALLSYCFCDDIVDTPLRAVRTVRAIPNCGGTSPIIYQSISSSFIVVATGGFLSAGKATTYTTIPYTPNVVFDANFNTSDLKVVCCVSEDSEIEVTPLTLTPNRNSPHNTGIANALKYDLYINNEGVYDYIPQTSVKTGEIVVTEDSTAVLGVLTTFLTELTVGSILYDNTGIKLGVVASITNNLNLVLESVALDSYSGEYRSQTFYFINPTLSSIFTYNDIIKGTYKLVATYNNACTSVSKEWVISICNATIINTGTCNNPSIQNLSAINYAKFTIKTSNSLDIVDSVSQKVILKDQIVDVLSTYEIPKLDDGFYQLDVQTLDEDGVVLNTESQLLFYDCNIKSCEVYLRSNLLGFSTCVDCVDKKANQKEYETLKLKNDMFQIYKDIIYSYWNNIKKQQSIDETWDIEDHLQEVTTYSNALKQIKTICTDCGFSFNTNTGTLSSGDCGCNG